MKLDVFMTASLIVFCGAILMYGQEAPLFELNGDVTVTRTLGAPAKLAEETPLESDVTFNTSKGSIVVHRDGRVEFPEGLSREQSAYIMAQCAMATIKFQNERYDDLGKQYDKLLDQYETFVKKIIADMKKVQDALRGKK